MTVPEVGRALRILVVERSALARVALVDILTRLGSFGSISISDPRNALARVRQVRPDVVLLGLAGGGTDAIAFLRDLMAEVPVPVVVCAGPRGNGSDLALQALDEGALEIAAPPEPGTTDALGEPALRLVRAVRAAAAARPAAFAPPGRWEAPAMAPALAAPLSARLVAIGGGAGGTQALRSLLRAMPPASPPFVVAQHLPAGFTALFAAQLDRECRIDVKEARSGDRASPGCALIAPGDRHLLVTGSPGAHRVDVVDRPPLGQRDRPSVDLLFRSVADCARAHAIGVVLTGAGEDGAAGLIEMERAGAVTLIQDPATCVAPGMPQSAIRSRSTAETVPLACLAPRILSRAV